MAPRRDPYRAVGALADGVRRRLYDYVAGQGGAVGREEVAQAVGVATHTARFHLDRLVDEGLLETEFRRLTGRSGPGSGRPAKLYRRAPGEVVVSLPARRYDLVGALLAGAVQRSLEGTALPEALAAAARSAGRAAGAARAPAGATDLDEVAGVLHDGGFEPRPDETGLVLHNCPFDALAREHAALVCGLNRDYVGGLLEGLACPAHAVLDPAPGRCCVRVQRTS